MTAPKLGVVMGRMRRLRVVASRPARRKTEPDQLVLDVLSHEIQAPLGVMRGYLSMIADETLTEPSEMRAAVQVISAKATEIEQLADVLISVSRMEAGRSMLRSSRFDVAEVAESVVARLSREADSGTVSLQTPMRRVMACADQGQVLRVLGNLVSNALKYSEPPARVTVEVRATVPVEVAVRDNGIGIAAEQRQAIFGRFVRAAEGKPGLGLGLWISRRLAEMNGGSLELAWSELGKGSEFVLRLPVAEQ